VAHTWKANHGRVWNVEQTVGMLPSLFANRRFCDLHFEDATLPTSECTVMYCLFFTSASSPTSRTSAELAADGARRPLRAHRQDGTKAGRAEAEPEVSVEVAILHDLL
jgi:hypothetical protein